MSKERFGDIAPTAHPGRPSPRVLAAIRRVISPLLRLLFRPTVAGLEQLPSGPYLLVANHSGAYGIAEIGSFVARYVERFGAERPLAGFAHPFGFRVWPLKLLMRGLGTIPSTYEDAARTLAAGVPILVFPGGDHEAFRPIWQANRVDFGGRCGFLRIARKASVPIVPMGFRGSHYTVPILWRSERLLPWLVVTPRLFGIKRYPLTLLAALMSLAVYLAFPMQGAWRWLLVWLCISSPLALLPWVPWTVRCRIGAPIPPEELFHDGGEDADLGPALARVEGAVQKLVSEP